MNMMAFRTNTARPGIANALRAGLFAVVCTWLSVASAVGQSETVAMPQGSVTVRQAIDEIQRQTGKKFAFSEQFDTGRTVRFDPAQTTLDQAVRLLAGEDFGYVFDGMFVIISKAKKGGDKSATVRGVVVNELSGKPEGGVRVEIVNFNGNGSKSATTSSEGRFSIGGIAAGSHVAKLTSGDGSSLCYREFSLPAGGDAHVTLSFGNDQTLTAPQAGEEREVSSTYYHPAPLREASPWDEPKSEYMYVPVREVNGDYLPRAAVKTNLLWWGTVSPNLAVEFGLDRRWTLDVSAVYNPFKLSSNGVNRIGLIQPEARYWFCNRFERDFIGLHGIYGRFNIGEIDLPFTDTFNEHRYEGWGVGAGISYGYHLPMGKRWGWEFTAGVGYVYLEYDKFRCHDCDEYLGKKNSHYFGPTKLGISLVFMLK